MYIKIYIKELTIAQLYLTVGLPPILLIYLPLTFDVILLFTWNVSIRLVF